jgi:Tfp pilus assembly protein PilF/TolB-like protein
MSRHSLLAAAVVLLVPVAAPAQVPSASPLLVVPFENSRGDSQRAWLREAVALLLTDALAGSGEATIGRDERLRAFDRLQIPALASLSRASVIKVGQTVGAVAVIVGSVEGSDAELTIKARVIQLDSGRLSPEVVAKGTTADLFAIVAQLAAGLRSNGQPAAPGAAPWRPPSARAFELYVKGLIADAPAAQVSFFEQALKDAPAYESARLALWQVHTDGGAHQRALAVVSPSGGRKPTRNARFLAALSQIHLKKFDEAFLALRDLQNETPTAAVANAIGVLELRRSTAVQPGRATYYFNQATELDEADGDLFFNLGYSYWLERDARATIYWLREAVRRDPTDGDAHFILATALQQSGATSEAARERELAFRLSSKYTAWEAKAAGGDPTPRGLERLHDELTNASARIDANVMTAGQREQDDLARFHLAAARRAFDRDADREAELELRRALFLSPYLADAHMVLARVYLRSGRAGEAIEALKIALWSDETAATHVLLAEAYLQAHDMAAARTEIERALVLDPTSPEAQRLRAKLAGGPW